MNKADLAVLGRIFADDIERALTGSSLPTQFRRHSKRIDRLAAEGYIEPDEVRLAGHPPVTVKGWRLTTLGHATYCFSCDEE